MAKERIPWTERDGKRFVYEFSVVSSFISMVLTLIAFVSPCWFVAWPRVYSGFRLIGLWEVCFSGMILELDPTQKSYHGCWWILAPEFWNIRAWLMPPWFIFTQVAVTICLVAEVIAFLVGSIIWLRTGKTQTDATKKPRRDPFTLIHILCGITVGSAILMSAAVIVFGIFAETDINWMPYPKFNYLSWSYGLAVVSAFFSIFSSISLVTYVMIIRQEMREPPKDISKTLTDTSQWMNNKDITIASSSSNTENKSLEYLKNSDEVFA